MRVDQGSPSEARKELGSRAGQKDLVTPFPSGAKTRALIRCATK